MPQRKNRVDKERNDMRIIISPAKKMRVDTDYTEVVETPLYVGDTRRILKTIKTYSVAELKALFRANDDITKLNYDRYRSLDLDSGLTPAVLSYVGLQYQSMAPNVFTMSQWNYVKTHLKILSGFYGILGACDGVVPYRLEMQAKLTVDESCNLYDFWGDKLYQELAKKDRVIINLASKEYSKAVEPYIESDVRFITCVFGEEKDGGMKVKATAAKMARGGMVRWMAEHQVEDAEQIKSFSEWGYTYSPGMSMEDRFVFVNRREGF